MAVLYKAVKKAFFDRGRKGNMAYDDTLFKLDCVFKKVWLYKVKSRYKNFMSMTK